MSLKPGTWTFLILLAGLAFPLRISAAGDLLLSLKEIFPLTKRHGAELQVWRERRGTTASYRLQWQNKESHALSETLSESKYHRLRDSMLQILFDREASPFPEKGTKCQPVLEISLFQLNERGRLCQGDVDSYARVRALLSELSPR